MKKDFDEEKAKIIVRVVPFVLIVLILFLTLLISTRKEKDKDADNQSLQESIMEYADSNKPETDRKQEENKEAAEEQTEAAEEAEEAAAAASPYQAIMQETKTDYSKITFDKEAQLKEMYAYWSDSNQEALDDLANLDRFKAMSYSLKDTEDFYYYGEKNAAGEPEGTGIAVYADNQYYYGGWKNGMRSGSGTWLHYHIHDTENQTDIYTFHQYTGSWVNDLPDGEGSEHYDFAAENLKANNRYYSNLIGSYQKGLVNGDFYITTIDTRDKLEEWNAVGEKGSWKYQNSNKDAKGNRTIMVDISNPDNYIWMKPGDNQNIGVPCLLSKYKN
jgi:hypothetical protein